MKISKLFNEGGQNLGYIAELYKLYLTDPELVEPRWREFFQTFEKEEEKNGTVNGSSSLQISNLEAFYPREDKRSEVFPAISEVSALQERVYRMISAFRNRGHLKANINPLATTEIPKANIKDIDISFYNFSEEELKQEVRCANFQNKKTFILSQLIDELHKVYCSTIGLEFTHILEEEARLWIQQAFECRFENGYRLDSTWRLRCLQKILDAEVFENMLHTKYIGHKRFSLEGAETVIPMLDVMLQEAGKKDVEKVVLGMAHRGRLNILANTVGKPLEEIFTEFEDQGEQTVLGSGDVKYHLGFRSKYITQSGKLIELLLAPNPSHLEAINPVVEGMARAIQDSYGEGDKKKAMPVLIHGDAAFVGQGIVYETLNFYKLPGYTTGGTIHIIINNQIGFTTNPSEGRSTSYCTDMAKGIEAPVYHVNGEDVEAACWAVKNAVEFRNRFNRDVIIDLYCYRKYGHNEGDDPSFTQPAIYREIADKESIGTIFTKQLVSEGLITEEEVEEYKSSYKEKVENAFIELNSKPLPGEACPIIGKLRVYPPKTGVEKDQLKKIANAITNFPENFKPHTKLVKILEKRKEAILKGDLIEWGAAEALAFGSLLFDGVNIRLSGEDVARGTFSHRHIQLVSNEDERQRFIPLNTLLKEGATGHIEVYNSPLSEAGVMGFEFGYSAIDHNSLVIWEAQFGDFANGAQVIIDQFVSSSEAKWQLRSGLVLLLPHGYEGQGPEHSSARLERYLQLCADGNMCVCYPTTSAQYFHLLRRQALQKVKRPLVVMTPKSHLRTKAASSSILELEKGKFSTVLEEDLSPDGKPKYLVCTTGKIYHDFAPLLKESKSTSVKIVRFEQLYPFPDSEFREVVRELMPRNIFWVQEEPQNMGAWHYIEPLLRKELGREVAYIGRPASASTATGSLKRHLKEQKEIVETLISAVS